ncbi:histidinol-phosphatase [Emcibacter sp. SYSU 3D8]|uniref:histidinol-phosphatase n=1 Tax=Emcibacter sp. SYSU 3D8 TaxID=3133969 RepID=UPI0031FF18B9
MVDTDGKERLSDAEARELLAFAHVLADAAGTVIRPLFRSAGAIDNKRVADFDPVTAADRDAEAAMRALIADRYPGHAVYGEEHGAEWGERFTWVLDPIDGTRSFIGGFPTWGTLIGLAEYQRPVLGIMDQPITGERFTGGPSGAFLGDRRLKVRPCANLEDAVLYSTTPDMFEPEVDMPAFRRVEERVKLRRFGGDCYAYCMMAHGLVDLIVEAKMQPYDIHALIPIVEAAGGIVTNWEGEPAWQAGRILAAGDRRVHEAALRALNG